MPDRIREPQNNAKSIDRWDNEGGAPSGGHHRLALKRPRDTSLQKKSYEESKKKVRWPDERVVSHSRTGGTTARPPP